MTYSYMYVTKKLSQNSFIRLSKIVDNVLFLSDQLEIEIDVPAEEVKE